MARITVTDNQGVVIETLDDEDIGNLERSLARAALCDQIRLAVLVARQQDEETK